MALEAGQGRGGAGDERQAREDEHPQPLGFWVITTTPGPFLFLLFLLAISAAIMMRATTAATTIMDSPSLGEKR
jgi:hypothetical protein